MLGFFKGLLFRQARATRIMRQTSRTDWQTLNREIFSRVISGGRFCIGVVSSGESADAKLKYRINQDYPQPEAGEFIRANFNGEKFAHVFTSRQGLGMNAKYGLLKVGNSQLGLPRKSLLVPVVSTDGDARRAVVIFGGEFIGHQMASRLEVLESLLHRERLPEGQKPIGNAPGAKSREALVVALEKLDVKRLFDQNLENLAEIVNGLEETREALPKSLKPKYFAAHQYLMHKRLKRNRE